METNNTHPRAKIGDVVIVKRVFLKDKAGYEKEVPRLSQLKVSRAHVDGGWIYFDDEVTAKAIQEDILKNLTTNISYE